MTTTPGNTSSDLPGKPPVVDQATWQAARGSCWSAKAHTREGDAIAAARRRLPMVEIDGAVEVTGADGPLPFVDVEARRTTWLRVPAGRSLLRRMAAPTSTRPHTDRFSGRCRRSR